MKKNKTDQEKIGYLLNEHIKYLRRYLKRLDLKRLELGECYLQEENVLLKDQIRIKDFELMKALQENIKFETDNLRLIIIIERFQNGKNGGIYDENK
ncbi:1400_t:CDS:2 [Scutellospora calospora]|uniref:1400_t:CDS:1 n=1 Tax=Scutellospora calospora TaxID=85575 RepID=A0ACA9L2T8_9GLOM|nr:1400_t:CDS:2 [Scutellospora calospora]